MRWIGRAWGNERGMTIVETVFATSVLLTFVTAATAGMVFSVRTVSRSAKQGHAVQLASAQIEKIRTLPFDSVGTVSPYGHVGNPAGSVVTPQEIDGYTINTQIAWVYEGMRVTSKLVVVTVDWENPSGSVREQTRVFGKTAFVNLGTLQVFVRDWDTAAPISGATAYVTPALGGSTYEDSTDATGQVTFGGLPAGSYNSSATAAGYLMPAPGTVGLAAVPADGFTTTTVRVQRPSSIAFTVTDEASVPIPNASVHITGPYSISTTLTTDAEGRTVFGDLYVGQYSYAVTKPGYTKGQSAVTILTGNEHLQVPVSLTIAGDMVVAVKDENGVAVSQPTIAIRGPAPSNPPLDGSPYTGGTNGQLSVTGMVEGTYTVTASKTGYIDTTSEVYVTGGATATLNMTLQRNPYGQLRIRITDRRGNGRGTYRIRVTGPNNFDNNNLVTDSGGYVLLTDLVAGDYKIYAPYSSGTFTQCVVVSGQLTTVTISIR